MRFVKKVIMIMVALGLIVSLAGTAALAEKVKITAATWAGLKSEYWYRVMLDKFEAENPGIEVELQVIAQGYFDRLLTQLAAGNPPDVFTWWDYTPTGAVGLEPLEGKGINFDNISPILNFYTQSADGTKYGVANGFSSRLMWYNKNLFDKVGLSYPKDEWTWEEFRDTAKKLTNPAEKVYGFMASPNSYGWVGWAWAKGGDFIDPTGTTMDGYLNSPETIEVIKFLTDLYVVDKVSPSPASAQAMGGSYEMMTSNKLAIMDSSTWFIGHLEVMGLDITGYGTVLWPAPRATIIHTNGWSMGKDCKHKKESIVFLRWIANEGLRIFGEAGFAFPNNMEIAKEIGLLDDPVTKTFFDALGYNKGIPGLIKVDRWTERFDTHIMHAFEKIMLGQATVEEALEWAVKESEAARKAR